MLLVSENGIKFKGLRYRRHPPPRIRIDTNYVPVAYGIVGAGIAVATEKIIVYDGGPVKDA
ncbi:hypothetical protein [Methanoculleus chikugoensis]|uniref:hypothetical protein n=1 Tax=Methanoculleus chikugoensis TaxID=118126 RepID=UPI0006D013B8|nr:hypothetical protein [Methanoculleus chikugoensis]